MSVSDEHEMYYVGTELGLIHRFMRWQSFDAVSAATIFLQTDILDYDDGDEYYYSCMKHWYDRADTIVFG